MLSVFFGFLSAWTWSHGLLDRLEYTTWTWRVAHKAEPGAGTGQVKLILLDQDSLDWAARESGLSWPWPREVYGHIIEFCRRGGARALAFDVLYLEDSAYGVYDDESLGAAIREGPPFAGAVFLGEETGRYTAWPNEVEPLEWRIEGLDKWLKGVEPGNVVMPRAAFPIPAVATNSLLLADVRGTPDPDGIIRRGNIFRVFDGQFVPSLGLGAYVAGSDRLPEIVFHNDFASFDGRPVPLDDKGRSILRYRGKPGTYDRYSAAEVMQSEIRIREGLEPTLSPEVFEDAYVLFGFSAPGLLDLRPTPMSPVTPGVEVHATMLDNFISGDFIRETGPAVVVPATILLAFAGALIIRVTRKAWHGVACFFVLAPVPVITSFIAYDMGFWWPVVVQEAALVMSMAGAMVVNYATEGRQKAFIKSAFKHYLSPAVIERILEDPSQLQLGGERRRLSIFFSDLQGFSSISENMEPQDLTRLLNDYLGDMTDIILEEGGTLDKYEGDAIIAFWNAPLAQEDHELRACRAALRCQRKLAERRSEFTKRAGSELRMRIGINTGDVVVGNMGSHNRFDYTVLGDAANLAARLEGANKAFGTFTMIAWETWKGAGEQMSGREMGRIRVVGRKMPVRVFEPLCFKDEEPSVDTAKFEEGLRLCNERKWQDALVVFKSLKNDPLSQTYAMRIMSLLDEPGESWDGIWNLSEK